MSNTLSHPTVKEYLKFVREEQAQQPLRPRQAVLLFYDKFVRYNHLSSQPYCGGL